jgi:hypothetical protein
VSLDVWRVNLAETLLILIDAPHCAHSSTVQNSHFWHLSESSMRHAGGVDGRTRLVSTKLALSGIDLS